MAAYSIGEIEKLTGLKAHVLRYWEQIIPAFSPKKDLGGRRVYAQRDIDIILRLKYLIYQKKFTIEGARDQILSEIDAVNKNADILKEIHELRQDLTELYLIVQKYSQKHDS